MRSVVNAIPLAHHIAPVPTAQSLLIRMLNNRSSTQLPLNLPSQFVWLPDYSDVSKVPLASNDHRFIAKIVKIRRLEVFNRGGRKKENGRGSNCQPRTGFSHS